MGTGVERPLSKLWVVPLGSLSYLVAGLTVGLAMEVRQSTVVMCSVMKSLEFSNMSVDPSSHQSSSGESDQAKTLETLLLEKNRALQTENTQLKVASNDLNGDCFIL